MTAKPAAKKAIPLKKVSRKPPLAASTKVSLITPSKGVVIKGKTNLNGSIKKKQAAVVKSSPPTVPSSPVKSEGLFGGFFSKSSEKVKQKEGPSSPTEQTSDPMEMCRVAELITSYLSSSSNTYAVPNVPKELTIETMYNKLIDFTDGASVKVHTPLLYLWIRNFSNTSATSWKQSFSHPFTESKNSDGKSGATFSKTQDERLLIKSLTDGELRALQELLPHLKSHFQNCGSSLINPPVSCYTVTTSKGKITHYVVLLNLLPRNSGISTLYDLKGSTQGRAASEKEHQKSIPLLKDNDWLSLVKLNNGKQLISAKPAVYSSIIKQIDKDITFLQRHDLMDYSLFIGQHPCFSKAVYGNSLLVKSGSSGFYLGIIDYLQKYNTSKKIAHVAKAITNNPNTLSTVPPKEYGDRFRFFMKNSVFEEGAIAKPTIVIRKKNYNSGSLRKPK